MRLLLPILFTALFVVDSQAQNISEFRGPDRSGIYQETDLLKAWPEEGPKEVFFIDSIGKGYGPPVISQDLMYLTGAIDSTSILFCFDLQGNKVWDMELGKEWVVNYPGSRSSPTIVDDLIYAGTGMGNLFCINKNTRSLVWEKSLADDFQGVLPLFGHSESPLIFGDKIFWTAGGVDYNVVALNRFTGKLIWSSKGFGERSAYHPPRVITTSRGKNILITFSAYHLMALDVDSGDLLWSHEQDNFAPAQRKFGYGDTHANTVIYDNGAIYYAEGDGNCGVKLVLSEDATKIKEAWRNKGFDSYMGGIVKLGDYLYGSGTVKPLLVSIEGDSGILSDSLSIGRGTIVVADNMIYYYSQRGTVSLVSYSNGKLTEVSSFRITKGNQEHFSHPCIYKHVMYIRHGDVVLGYEI